MAANMYRVGDYVFFETSSTTPYQIRRIEELNKTPNGNVEAKVMCFYRRRDISSSLTSLADKHQKDNVNNIDGKKDGFSPPDSPETETELPDSIGEEIDKNYEDIPDKQKHQLKHRELFLSRQVETLPATHIRGKCVVTLLNETESLISYLSKDDTFFYSLVYDPQQKTLLADKGEIRVGSKFQAEVHPKLENIEDDDRRLEDLEDLVWDPGNGVKDKDIDQFLILARSVGTFARALDCTSTVRQPSLHMSAAAASRDITLMHAMDTLHKTKYNVAKAVSSLVPSGGPILCRDEMEEWSASEANLFEEALDKYGKDFSDIRQDFLPWKSLQSIVEYYYMWKTTDRYVQQKRIKAAEAESKLKQVYIPNYNKPNPAAISGKVNGVDGQLSGRACEGCYASHSQQWYSWGPTHMQCRLCAVCWTYWKKYGGLKMPTRLDGERPGPDQRQGQLRLVESGNYTPNIKPKVPTNIEPVMSRLGAEASKLEKAAAHNKLDGHVTSSAPSIMRKRGYEQSNGIDAVPSKKPSLGLGVIKQIGSAMRAQQPAMRGTVINHMNGRSNKVVARSMKMQMISWMDAPDDVYFVATGATRNLRRQLSLSSFKRAARNPWRVVKYKPPVSGTGEVVVLD